MGSANSKEAPIDSTMPVISARDAYLAENGFTVAGYDDAWTPASFFCFDFAVPNTKRHRWGIMLHDLHHVASGYGTDLVGEAEISAFELRGGLKGLGLYVGSLVSMGAMMGVIIAPRRTYRAWKSAKGARSLWTQTELTYDSALEMSVGELRERIGFPLSGVATEKRKLHKNAPKD